MGNIDSAATFMTSEMLEFNAIGDAMFADWYPHHRSGDPMPVLPPGHIMEEARELALQHRMVAARKRGLRAA